ncbi:helix-turn-helix domain-containing protein [Streptomyces sp. NPDC020996]|uniref:helix-turn-helix domain-containing protein n=1 Tax=Streptomyces sp. NPDC020996 TaxID=3154791 RepID=UPI0033FEEF21
MSRTSTADCRTERQDEWLTPREASALTKLSLQTLANHRYLKIGIPYTKLSSGRAGRVRYRRSDVERYLNSQAVA